MLQNLKSNSFAMLSANFSHVGGRWWYFFITLCIMGNIKFIYLGVLYV